MNYDIDNIFNSYSSIAVVGMSKNPLKAAFSVPNFFIGQGYKVTPVNPTATDIAGKRSYPTLSAIPIDIDIVNIFRPSEDVLPIVEEAIERKKIRGDIHVIWLQEGIVCEKSRKLAEENGIIFVQDMCMYKEYLGMKNRT
jgi:hypothetical protein